MDFISVSSNINEMVAALEDILNLHRSKSTSAFRIPSVKWKLSLYNDATTKAADGSEFPYYFAVDKGRKAVSAKKGKWLVFGSARNPTFAKSVKAAGGLHITAKSLAAIHATYNTDLSTALDRLSTGRATTKGFSMNEFFHAANSAASQARVAGSKASRFRVSSDNNFFKLLVKLPNWEPIAATFEKVTQEKSLKEFRRNTPRKLRGKLHYVGGGQLEAVPTPSGQHLRDGFKINRDKPNESNYCGLFIFRKRSGID